VLTILLMVKDDVGGDNYFELDGDFYHDDDDTI
jgi:hypothetical protein